MAINYDKLLNFLKDYKIKKDHQPLITLLKSNLDSNQRISADITENFGQQYCSVLIDILNELEPTNTDVVNIVDIISECLIQQVTSANVRWYFLERCQLLNCLTRKFLMFSNSSIKIKIAKALQTYLIYSPMEGKNFLTQDVVAELLKQLVNILRGNHPQEFYEASLGLLASLCQIWGHCQDVMSVIDDYQILRKQLLRFLSAEMVKRTTIVYTMTIMFHLCNSDDRLFNKRNIRQTLQVLFNIMLNGDTGWASLYAASLLTEICKSTRTSHLLAEYRSLNLSLKETINQLNTKDKITTEKYFEFILNVMGVNSEYQHMVMNLILSIDSNSETWEKDCDEHGLHNDSLDTVIQLIGNADVTTSIYSIRLLNEIYMELISRNKDSKLPKLRAISEVIHQFLSSVVCISSTKSNMFNSDEKTDLGNLSIEACVRNRQQLSTLLKIKHVIQFITDLLRGGDQWLDQATSLINCTDRIIRDQLDSNPLTESMSLSKNQMIFKLSSLGVDVFIDLLYFYYRATETKPTSNLFGERLKTHLEQPKCPTMLAFALSAASQNQSTLQRALVLQGVCLHLQEFNVEMMGEKMYKFSTEYSSLKSDDSITNKHSNDKLSSSPSKLSSLAETADGDTGFHLNKNHHLTGIKSENEPVQMFSNQSDLTTLKLLRSNINRKSQSNTVLTEGDVQKSDNVMTNSNDKFIDDIKNNVNIDKNEKLNIDSKIQLIVKKWMEKPESSFSTAEIYLIFEHRIQSMQNQEALMEEIISNKTAALHQSEALLNQYRSKLNDSEKESKQLRNLQVETESKIDILNHKIEFQLEKMVEMEKINQTLIETNRMSEKQKDDCLSISKKIQEKLAKISDEKLSLERTLEDYCKQLEEAQKLISLKDNQISNYTQMTKLINKLTGNKFSVENSLDQFAADDVAKSNSSAINDFESYPNAIKSASENFCVNNNNNISSSTNIDLIPSAQHKRTTSQNDFLHLYKTNCRILQNHK